MTTIQAASYVIEHGCALMRPRVGTAHEWDLKPYHGGNKRRWFYMDIQTANMLVTVYAALSEEHKGKFNRIPLGKLVDFGWKHVKAGA